MFFCEFAFADYDIILTGVIKYETPVSYSNKTILVADDGFVEYDDVVTFVNCVMDVNGLAKFNSDMNFVNSVINVKGDFKTEAGIEITETGASSIIATGNSLKVGKIIFGGRLDNRIRVYSDYAGDDAEFIIINSSSSSDSTIECVDFIGGWCNIQIYDKRLSSGISNCRFFGADYGVYQDGIDELTDVRFSLFYWNDTSIYLGIDGAYGAEVECLVDNVVIDNQYGGSSYGVVISGQTSVPDFTSIRLTNSIITKSFCGWFISIGGSSFYPPLVSNIAYHENANDDNIGSPGFQINPMPLAQSPFVVQEDPNEWPYFINPNSPVADVNLGYDLWQSAPQQLVTSLFEDSTPRGNKGIGFGMPVPSGYSSNILKSNLDDKGIVNFLDFSKFAMDWLSERGSLTNPVNFPDPNGYSIADFNRDEIVDTNDLQNFCSDWLSEGAIDLEVTDSLGSLTVTSQILEGLNTGDYAFFLNGKYIATRDPVYNPDLIIDKMKLPKGESSANLQAVVKGDNEVSYATKKAYFSVSTPLSDLTFEEIFDPDKHYPIRGKVDNGHTATISFVDMDGQTLWSGVFTEDFTAFVDPDSVNWEDVSYKVTYDCVPTLLMVMGSDSPLGLIMEGSSSSTSGSSSILALGGKPTLKTAGLLICMIENGMTYGTTYLDTGNVRYADKMMKERGVARILLRGYGKHNQVNRATFGKVFKKYHNIRYFHSYAHGHYESDGAGFWGFDILRTRQRYNDGDWPAFNSKIWTLRGLDVPEDYEYLSKSLEAANCLAMFPFRPGQIVVAVMVSCHNLRNIATIDANGLCHYVDGAYQYELDNDLNAHPDYPYSDITFAFDIWTDKQVVLGSGGWVLEGAIMPYWRRFFNKFWEGLRYGETAYGSLMDYAIPVANTHVMRYFRSRGIGLNNAKLSSNPGTYGAYGSMQANGGLRDIGVRKVFSAEGSIPVANPTVQKQSLHRNTNIPVYLEKNSN